MYPAMLVVAMGEPMGSILFGEVLANRHVRATADVPSNFAEPNHDFV